RTSAPRPGPSSEARSNTRCCSLASFAPAWSPSSQKGRLVPWASLGQPFDAAVPDGRPGRAGARRPAVGAYDGPAGRRGVDLADGAHAAGRDRDGLRPRAPLVDGDV